MSADPVVVAGVAGRLHLLAVDLLARGLRDDAFAIEREARLLARPSDTTLCKGSCGRPVPDVEFGRPRLYCHTCRAPRTKGVTKVGEPVMVGP